MYTGPHLFDKIDLSGIMVNKIPIFCRWNQNYDPFQMMPPDTWWRHQMEAFSALLALCAGNSPVTSEFPSQRPVTQNFDVFFDMPLNKWLNNREAGDLRRHPVHYDAIVMNLRLLINGASQIKDIMDTRGLRNPPEWILGWDKIFKMDPFWSAHIYISFWEFISSCAAAEQVSSRPMLTTLRRYRVCSGALRHFLKMFSSCYVKKNLMYP